MKISTTLTLILLIIGCTTTTKLHKDDPKLAAALFPAYEKDYNHFVQRQKTIRKKLEAVISKEDQAKVNILRAAYDEGVSDRKERFDIMKKGDPNFDSSLSDLLLRWYNDKTYNTAEIVIPMLAKDLELKAMATDLANKYSKAIYEARKAIKEEKRKLEKIRARAYRDYVRERAEPEPALQYRRPLSTTIDINKSTEILIVKPIGN